MGQAKQNHSRNHTPETIRYAVVGLGHIAQVAVLPAFANAPHCELVAIFSRDPTKLKEVGDAYGLAHRLGYEQYRDFLQKGLVDAVYIALPNHLHCEYTLAAADAGVHVLCEKPMAVTPRECRQMIDRCARNDVRLMIAYRLHFEAATQQVIAFARDGTLGNLRYFDASFSQDVQLGNVRLNAIEEGGGTLFDMGIYCINAARAFFNDEPYEVMGWSASGEDQRFEKCDEMTSAIMRFPGNRLATFTSSFGAAKTDQLRLVGSLGEVEMSPAFGYATHLRYELTLADDMRARAFKKRDQFSPELSYFADCIRKGVNPEPDGYEGMADVQIIQAIYRSAREGMPVRLEGIEPVQDTGSAPAITRPGFEKPDEVHARGPKRDG